MFPRRVQAVLDQWVGANRLRHHLPVARVHQNRHFKRFAARKKTQAIQILPSSAGFSGDQFPGWLAFIKDDGRKAAEFDLLVLEVSLSQTEIRHDRDQQRVLKE